MTAVPALRPPDALKAFIRQWQEKKDCYIGSPANSDAVRIMTIHKSKEAHPEWFGGLKARNELSVFGSDGALNRPDRVVVRPDGSVDIIDYKFGAERPSYLRQVGRYMKLYRDMGSRSVRGFVWYVPEDKVVEV